MLADDARLHFTVTREKTPVSRRGSRIPAVKRLVMDLDGTLTVDAPGVGYADKAPRADVVAKLREYKAAGFAIVIATARNMRTFNNSVGHINAVTLPVLIDWLRKHGIPYDEIYVGKPWCGEDGFYVDDKAIRPAEFVALGYDEIKSLLACPAATVETKAGGL